MNKPAIKDPKPNPVGHAAIEGTLDIVISQCDLPKEIEKLHKEDAWLKSTGPSSKTLVKHPDLRIVLIAMRGKMCMHEHRTAARISIQTLEGHIRLRLGDRTVDLALGQLLVLDHCVSHDVETEEDSAFLLTLSWPVGEADKCETDERRTD
jgi:quercetin dioxygenase-like cupin family protein